MITGANCMLLAASTVSLWGALYIQGINMTLIASMQMLKDLG